MEFADRSLSSPCRFLQPWRHRHCCLQESAQGQLTVELVRTMPQVGGVSSLPLTSQSYCLGLADVALRARARFLLLSESTVLNP